MTKLDAAIERPDYVTRWRISRGGSWEIAITMSLRIESVSNMREHWARKAKRAKHHRQTTAIVVGAYLRSRGIKPPCIVILTRIAPRRLDGDNLQAALKAVRDGVADALGVDDRDPAVTWEYAERRGQVRQYGVEIALATR